MSNKNGIKRNRYVNRWARVKRAVDLLGGKCCKCGESHIATLSFHHLDPKDKDAEVSRLLTLSDWGAIEKEIKKCVLLCENCHRKEHFNETSYTECYEDICLLATGTTCKHYIRIRRWSNEDTEKLIALYNEGKSTPEISLDMGRMPQTIRKRIKRLSNDGLLKPRDESGIKRKSRIIPSSELIQKVRQMGANRFTALEIAAETGLSVGFIFKVLRNTTLSRDDP